MIRYLKKGKTQEELTLSNHQVKIIVEDILADIESRGDEAIREYSDKFDKWTPKSFKLSKSDIQACYDQVDEQAQNDIRWAQKQIRNFAQIQRDSMLDVEVETLPGVTLGHKHIPVNSVGCYIPGGKYPLLASAHMGVLTAKVAASSASLLLPHLSMANRPRPLLWPWTWLAQMKSIVSVAYRLLRPWRLVQRPLKA